MTQFNLSDLSFFLIFSSVFCYDFTIRVKLRTGDVSSLDVYLWVLLLVFCNHTLLLVLTTELFHILGFFLPSFSFVSIFRFPFLPEHPLFEDATVFRCVLSGSQLWRAPSPNPTRLPALSNHHSPYGSQRRGTQLSLSRYCWGQLGRQRQLLRGGRGLLVSLQPDAGRPAHQMRQLQVRRVKALLVSMLEHRCVALHLFNGNKRKLFFKIQAVTIIQHAVKVFMTSPPLRFLSDLLPLYHRGLDRRKGVKGQHRKKTENVSGITVHFINYSFHLREGGLSTPAYWLFFCSWRE